MNEEDGPMTGQQATQLLEMILNIHLGPKSVGYQKFTSNSEQMEAHRLNFEKQWRDTNQDEFLKSHPYATPLNLKITKDIMWDSYVGDVYATYVGDALDEFHTHIKLEDCDACRHVKASIQKSQDGFE